VKAKNFFITVLGIVGLILLVAAICYKTGRRDERMSALEARLASAEGDLHELKQAKVHQEAQWGWLKRIGQGARALLPWGK